MDDASEAEGALIETHCGHRFVVQGGRRLWISPPPRGQRPDPLLDDILRDQRILALRQKLTPDGPRSV